MRRTLTILAVVATLATLVLGVLPALAANVAVGNSGAAGDCAGNFTYEPSSTAIQPGDSVTFSNPRVHNNGCAAAEHPTQCIGSQSKGDCPFQTEDLPVGGSFTVDFPAEGTFKYRCVAHPYMIGTITVGDGDPSQPPPPPPSPSPSPSPSPKATTPAPTTAPSPSPSPTSQPSPTVAPTATETSDEPAASETDEAVDEPTTTDSPEPDDSPEDDATESAVGSGAEGDGESSGVDTIPASSGGGTKAIATVLLLVTGGALWSVRRGS